MADFNPISENFNPTGPSPDISWPDSVQYESGLVPPGGTDVREFFETPDNTPYSFPAVRGAAVSVQQSLSNITFVPGTFGGMSSSIAYIRYWSKNGSGQKTAVGSFAQNGTVNDSQESLLNDFVAVSKLDLGVSTQPQQVIEPSRTILTTPTNTAYQSRPRQPVPSTTTSSRPTGPNVFQRLGSIFSANPGGSVAPAWQNPFFTPPAAPSPDGAVWQFLFNPEELQLSSGPDFNRAETWGVSDPDNSGQPLSWRSNKNRKLTFGKVLLHGYTFGKRVDSLESGLQALFTARDGNNGSDGPPVLEFVWGQRVFGPCVIQNIQVRERAWDKGLLVNAEVSFELEQVPEWTINDGFVDVLRPGRQSTVNDPLATSNKDDGGGGDKEEKKNEPGGGGGKPNATLSQCKNLSSDVKVWNDREYEINKKKSGTKGYIATGPIIPGTGLPSSQRLDITPTFPSLLSAYSNTLSKFSGNSLYGKNIKPSIIGDKCFKQKELLDAHNVEITIQNIDKEKVSLKYNQIILVCVRNIKSVIVNERKSLNCSTVEKNDPSRTFIGPVRGST